MRALHLGLGNFFRAHQAWYTQHADPEWGIAAFTGRHPQAALALAAQKCRYTLDVRGPNGDDFEQISAVAAAHAGDDDAAWLAYWADPDVVLLTMTITEAGYRAGPAISRIVTGLKARWRADAGPMTLIPCDNLPHNGQVLADLVVGLAAQIDPELPDWIATNVGFVSTAVDRITPATTEDDVARIASAVGWRDAVPVVTEPFSEWVLTDAFTTPRPPWDNVGATITSDVLPYEQRKLTLLNGAHSLMSYAGPLRGHTTVAQAIADPQIQQWVRRWWDEADPYLAMPPEVLHSYEQQLLLRWANPDIRHLLSQIAMDGSQKLAVRLPPTIRAHRAAGRMPVAACHILAAWIVTAREGTVTDPERDRLLELAKLPDAQAVAGLIAVVDPALAADDELVAEVVRQVRALAKEAAH